MSERSNGSSEHAKVYEVLKTMLVEYRFLPGEQLLIGELATRLRVSATPIREILIRLQAEGLLDPTPRRGFFAKTLCAREMSELYQLRYALARHAIEAGAPADKLAIQAIAADPLPVTDVSVSAYGLPDEAHCCACWFEKTYEHLVALSGNEAMVAVVRNANDRTHYILTIDLEILMRLSEAHRRRHELCAALQTRDSAAAIAALKRELDGALQIMPKLIKEGIGRSYTALRSGSGAGQLGAVGRRAMPLSVAPD